MCVHVCVHVCVCMSRSDPFPLLDDSACCNVQTAGVRIGWLQASEVLPLLVRREDAKNIYVVKCVREGLAKLQYVDKQVGQVDDFMCACVRVLPCCRVDVLTC